MREKTFENPVLPGFYPDPSVCRVNDDYYLVCSSFAYFPGLPVFHSKDLVHWKQICNALDRNTQINLLNAHTSGGIYAPTIRYHQGTFYIITTNESHLGNFVITASNPAGPWSDAVYLDAPGIDPSLFFDRDGTAWYVGTREKPKEKALYWGNNEIYLRQMDLENLCLVGDTHVLWEGALRNAYWPEGPHLYYKDGWYYLMIAEGGTELTHSVAIARSRSLKGPYEASLINPILTHRHMGKDYPILNPGHADLVETQNGEWYMILLATRPCEGYSILGRETFLAPVTWENGWPVVAAGYGRVLERFPVPDLPVQGRTAAWGCDPFEDDTLDDRWISLRSRDLSHYDLNARKGFLRLIPFAGTLKERACEVAYVALRQRHLTYAFTVAMEYQPLKEGDRAGIAVFQSEREHYKLFQTVEQGRRVCKVERCTAGVPCTIAVTGAIEGRCYLRIMGEGLTLSFWAGKTPGTLVPIAQNINACHLSPEIAGGFVGNTLGMFAEGSEESYADFDSADYAQAHI